MSTKNIINTPLTDFTTVNIDERKKINIKTGDTVKVWVKIIEKDKKGKEKIRFQAFEGLVISTKHGTEPGATFTVRKTSYGVGIERIFPLFSPMIDKIEILKRGNVRKSKIYFVRDKVTKAIKRITRKSELVNISTTSDTEEKRLAEQKAKEWAEKKEAEANTETTETSENKEA